jgi:predicted nucleic acid-binding protein
VRTGSTLGRRSALIDTSAFFALGDRHNAVYPIARAIQDRLIGGRWRVVTTNFVVAETHALVLARRDRTDAARVLREIDGSKDLVVVRVEEGDERRAREIIYQYTDKDFSLTDATSFAVIERLGVGYAFTFDRHFAQYGFAVLSSDAVN